VIGLTPQGRQRGVRSSISLAVGAAMFLTGVTVASLIRGGAAGGAEARSYPSPAPSPQAQTLPGPREYSDGIPAGFARSRAGAVAAATRYILTGQALLDLDPRAAEEGVRRMTAAEAAGRLVDDTLRQLRDAREALSGGTGPIVFRQAVLAYRVEAFTPERARVAVWNVGVLARQGVAPPQAGWAISTLDLVWERGDWRIWAETVVPGPAPILNDSTPPATARQLLASLEGFVDFARSA
jgi:hypothetical protein